MAIEPIEQEKTTSSAKTLSVTKTILAILWDIGEGTVKAFFPHPYSHAFCHHKTANAYHSAVTRLKQHKLIKKKGRDTFYLTPRGEREALFAFLNAEVKSYVPEKQKWDGGWRIVFFDIPEKKRRYRDYLRGMLRAIGFQEFQKSVWIYPYQVPSFLRDILFEENIKRYTHFITTEHIESDGALRKIFKLSNIS